MKYFIRSTLLFPNPRSTRRGEAAAISTGWSRSAAEKEN